MNEPIKVGDLVQIVKAKPCGCRNGLGAVFVVGGTIVDGTGYHCTECGFIWDRGEKRVGFTGYRDFAIDPRRLKRIPPLSELGGEKRRDEVEA